MWPGSAVRWHMDYFKILNLYKEPFSNSPEPEFFYESPQHVQCLQQLELAIRLRRGLNVVIGDVGTGKTTLCRQLIGKFVGCDNIQTHLLLDPHFSDPLEFLYSVSRMFGIEAGARPFETEWQVKEDIKNYLFQRGVEDDGIVVLIIDEGQKIPDFCLEILREFLNYETNQYKLLQIVIFAQNEFRTVLEEKPNVADRINFRYDLEPLNFRDTRSMICHRIAKASETGESTVRFTYPALKAIHNATGGYPRKIVSLCHQIMLAVIVQNKTKVDWFLAHSCVKRRGLETTSRVSWGKIAAFSVILTLLVILGLGMPQVRKIMHSYTGILLSDSARETVQEVSARVSTSIPDKVTVTAVGKDPANSQCEHDGVVKGESVESVAVVTADETPAEQIVETENADDGDMDVARESAEAMMTTPERARQAEYPPVILGQLEVRRGWMVSMMIARICGVCDSRHLKLIRDANPHIRDINHVRVGDIIIVPAIPAASKPPSGVYWVQVEEKETLRAAHDYLDKNIDKRTGLRIVPYWNSREGLNFAIVMNRGFNAKVEAREALDALPLYISRQAKIVDGWDKDTVFFTDLS